MNEWYLSCEKSDFKIYYTVKPTKRQQQTCYNLISQSVFYTFQALKTIIRRLVLKIQAIWYHVHPHIQYKVGVDTLGLQVITNFDVLMTVHLSIFISVINQLDAQIFCFAISLFHASTCFEHYVFVIRRSKLHYTASGIITLKQVSGLKLLKYNSINISK